MSALTPPTPAAVRAAMKLDADFTTEEYQSYADENRMAWEILRDHIRAVVQEMRAEAKVSAHYDCTESADTLNRFADKLEGKQ